MRQILGAMVVAVCVGVPIVEGFDRWDNTLQDGNDTEANLVVAAVCVGFVLSVTTSIIARLRPIPIDDRVRVSPPFAAGQPGTSFASLIPTSSPPTPLRI